MREWGTGTPGGVEDMERGIGPPVGGEGSGGTCGDDGVEHCAEMEMEDSTYPLAHQLGGGLPCGGWSPRRWCELPGD